MRRVKMELATARWFSKTLEDGVNVRRKGFYVSHREGDMGFTVQRCTNIQGAFMALEEHRQGECRNSILVPVDRDGRGWRKLAEVVRDVAQSVGQAPPAMTLISKSSQSYKEALQHPRSLVPSCHMDKRAASGTISTGNQRREEDGRRGVGLQKERVLRVMTDMEKQMGELHANLNRLKWCIEDQGWGLASEPGDGPEGHGLEKGTGPKG